MYSHVFQPVQPLLVCLSRVSIVKQMSYCTLTSLVNVLKRKVIRTLAISVDALFWMTILNRSSLSFCRTSSEAHDSKEAAPSRESESTSDKKAKLSDAKASCENTSTTVTSSRLGALLGLAAYSSSESDNGD